LKNNENLARLKSKLVELNLIADDVGYRSEHLWIDAPPAVDKSIGVGEVYAWQSPLHREAVKRALEELRATGHTRF